MPVLDELIVVLGYDYDSDGIDNFKNDVAATTSIIKKFIVAAIAGATAIGIFTDKTSDATDQQGKFADEIGELVEEVDAYSFALVRAGGTSEAMESTLKGLNTKIGETARGVGAGIEAFGLLGISVQGAGGELKKGSALLLEIADKFETLSRAQQLDLAGQLGISGSLRLIQQGRSEIEKLTAEARAFGVTTAKDAKIAADFKDSLANVFKVVSQVSRIMSNVFSPVLKDMANGLTEWWLINRELIEQNIPTFIEKGARAIKLLAIAAGAFVAIRLGILLLRLVAIMRSLSVVTALTAGAVLILPTLISAGLIAIGLLAKDAQGFFNGADSAIGDLIKRFPEWENQIIVVAAAAATLADVVDLIFTGWSKLLNMFNSSNIDQTIADFQIALSTIPDILTEQFAELFQFIEDGFRAIPTMINEAVEDLFTFDSLKFLLNPFGGFIPSLIGSNNSSPVNPFGGLISSLTGSTNSSPINPVVGQGTVLTTNSNSRSNTTNIGSIKINVNSTESASRVADATFKVFQQAQQDLNSTVDQ